MQPATQQDFPNQIRYFRKRAALSLEELATRANTTKSQIHKLERGHRRLTVDWMMRLAKAMDLKPADLLPESITGHTASNDDYLPAHEQTVDLPMKSLHNLSAPAMSFVARPSSLLGCVDAFAVYMDKEVMAPRFFTGEVMYIKPHAPIEKDVYVLIKLKSGEKFVAQVSKMLPEAFSLRQYNPLNYWEVAKDKIATIYRIVGSTET